MLKSQIDGSEKEWMLTLFVILYEQESILKSATNTPRLTEKNSSVSIKKWIIYSSLKGLEFCGEYCAIGALHYALLAQEIHEQSLSKSKEKLLSNSKLKMR